MPESELERHLKDLIRSEIGGVRVEIGGLHREMADMKARNTTDHAIVRETIAELKDELATRDRERALQISSVDARVRKIEDRLSGWRGSIGAIWLIFGPAVTGVVVYLVMQVFG